MLPRWHIFLGAIFTLILWLIYPQTNWIYLSLVFLSSFLIDFDHYAASVIKTGRWSLKESFKYHEIEGKRAEAEKKRGIRRTGDFHLFHTIEFHLLVFALGFFWSGFFYIFAGMIFHSLLDVIAMLYTGFLYRREYFFINWLRKMLF